MCGCRDDRRLFRSRSQLDTCSRRLRSSIPSHRNLRAHHRSAGGIPIDWDTAQDYSIKSLSVEDALDLVGQPGNGHIVSSNRQNVGEVTTGGLERVSEDAVDCLCAGEGSMCRWSGALSNLSASSDLEVPWQTLVNHVPSVLCVQSNEFKAKKKPKHTYVWQCCYCGSPSIPYRDVGCPNCSYARCGNCTVSKILVR